MPGVVCAQYDWMGADLNGETVDRPPAQVSEALRDNVLDRSRRQLHVGAGAEASSRLASISLLERDPSCRIGLTH